MKHNRRRSCAAALLALVLSAVQAHAGSVRFFGNGTNDIDRIKIRVDDPANSDPGPPVDVGADDFTIEFFIKGALADNTGVASCGDTYGWITGNVVLDRDRFNQDRGFGISTTAGAIAFGANVGGDLQTLCGSRIVLDGNWHHVAVTRDAQTGVMRLFVDGIFDGEANGPVGDLSYPDDGLPGLFCGPNGNESCENSDPFLVLGAEKHDANPASFPSFAGQLDELRISRRVLYDPIGFLPPGAPFDPDGDTAALYHFDETGNDIVVTDVLGESNGVRNVGGTPEGPQWVEDTPFLESGPGTLQFASLRYRVTETEGTLRARVARAGGFNGPVSVLCTPSSGTAQAPDDFTATPVTLAWSDGERAAKECAVAIVADDEAEASEEFTLELSNPSNATLGKLATATAIIEEDVSGGLFRFVQNAATAGEDVGTINLAVARTGSLAGAVTVTLVAESGSATSASDFTLSTTTLTWADGEAGNKNAVIAIVNDGDEESDETFTLRIDSVAGGGTTEPSSVTITIRDDDSSGGGGGGGGAFAAWALFALTGLLAARRRPSQESLS